MRARIFSSLLVALTLAVVGVHAADDPPDPARGAKLYSANCGRCHNLRAATELGDLEWAIVVTHMRVTAGLPGDQARDIEAFLQASNTPSRPPLHAGPKAAERSGRELVGEYGCQGCHVIGGTGGTIGPDLDTVFERRDEAWVGAQIANAREHNPDSVMPVLGLTKGQINAIVEFLRKSQ